MDDYSGRDKRGRWLPGNGGRPVGAKGKAARSTLAQVRAMGPTALVKLWEALNRDERWAVEMILERILPAGRVIELEAARAADVAEALAAGDLSPSEGAALATAMLRLRQLQAIEDVEGPTIAADSYQILEGDTTEAAAEKYRIMLEIDR